MSPKRRARILELPEVEQRCATTWAESIELKFCTDWKSFCEMRAAAMSNFWLGRVATPPGVGDGSKKGPRVTSKEKKLKRRENLRAKLKAIELEMGPAEVADAGV